MASAFGTSPGGWSGTSGASGFSGCSGYSGAGTSGYSGAGTSGYSGSSGAMGTSGYSGRSGPSGYSGSLARPNVIDNPDFNVWQRGSPINVTDDHYAADRWNVLTQTAGVSGAKYPYWYAVGGCFGKLIQYQAAAQRCMWSQIIPSQTSKSLRGRDCYLSCLCWQDTTLTINARYALLWWTGDADTTVVSDVVNDWTSSNYTLGNFFASGQLALIKTGNVSAPTTNFTYLTATISAAEMGSADDSHNKNLILCLWFEPAIAQNKTVMFADVQLYQGTQALAFQSPSPGASLAECQRYFTALSSTTGNKLVGYVNYGTGPSYMWFSYHLPVTMRAAPVLGTGSAAAGDYQIFTGINAYYACTALPYLVDATPELAVGAATAAAGLTPGWAGMLNFKTAGVSIMTFSADL